MSNKVNLHYRTASPEHPTFVLGVPDLTSEAARDLVQAVFAQKARWSTPEHHTPAASLDLSGCFAAFEVVPGGKS